MRLLREAVPRLLNLGVRKHLKSEVHTFQPATALIPPIMSLSGKPELYVNPATPETMASRVTFIIKGFERPTCLKRLLESIATQYKTVPTLVLDDSKEPLFTQEEQASYQEKIPAIRFLRTGYDVGLAAGRNILVDAVETPYVLLLDDDFILNENSKIERLVDALEWGRFDLAGGCIDSAWSYLALRSPGRLEIKPDIPCFGTPSRQPDYEADGLTCFQTDFINNFFLGRTAALKEVKWDPRLKLGEHEDFYLRVMDKGLRVGLCRGATSVNDNSCDSTSSYKSKRGRVFDYWVLVFKKWGIDTMKTAAGEYKLMCPAKGEKAPAEAEKEETVPGLEGCSIDVNQENIWFNK
jgi:GT2 family glycosyltransferase